MLAFVTFIIAFALSAPSFALRPENLPGFCKSLYPKLLSVEKRPLSREEITELFEFAKKPLDEQVEYVNSLNKKSERHFLEKLILLRWQVKDLPEFLLEKSQIPSLKELKTEFPKVSEGQFDDEPLRDKLARTLLSRRIEKASRQVAEHLGKSSSHSEKLETFKSLLNVLNQQDLSWYHQSKIDSLVDLASGIETGRISKEIQKESHQKFNQAHKGEETYAFASPELLLSPYSEIFNLFEAVGLKDTDTVVDLGAGFGRVGLALAAKYPGVHVYGYEIVKDRIQEGARVAEAWGLQDRIKLIEQNLADTQFKPAAADVYFAFNPVSGETFDKILEDLRQVGLQSGKKFRFVVFGPSPFHKTDAQPWLKELKGPGIPQGTELKIYEFVPERASHTERVDSTTFSNPYALKESVPTFPDSRPLQTQDLREGMTTNPASFLSPHYLSAWASHWPIEISKNGKMSLVFSRKSEAPNQEHFIEPLGGSDEEKADLIKKILLERKAQGIDVEFSYLSDGVHKLLIQDPDVHSFEDPTYSDFVYRAQDLSELSRTKRLRDRSKQSAAFKSSHPSAQVEVLSEGSPGDRKKFQESANLFLKDWLEDKLKNFTGTEHARSALKAEGEASRVLTDKLIGPKTIQMAITETSSSTGPNSIIAYASGEIRPGPFGKNTLVLYVQKSDGTKNVIPFINRRLVDEVLAHPEVYGEVEFVNMMDASTEGLRQFKAQYDPDLSLGKTYSARLK